MTEAYPLHWPEHWPRTQHPERSRFATTFGRATREVLDELRRLEARYPVLSTNVPVRLDGIPYANHRAPDDPGVAVYFELDGTQQCIPCDKWDRVGDNMHAIALTIEALRGLERWGARELVKAAFSGFEALPAPADWQTTLGLRPGCTLAEAEQAYRHLAKDAHPDAPGGSHARMAELNDAIRQARAEG